MYTQMHACCTVVLMFLVLAVPTLHIAITRVIIIGTEGTRVPYIYTIAMQNSYKLHCSNTIIP